MTSASNSAPTSGSTTTSDRSPPDESGSSAHVPLQLGTVVVGVDGSETGDRALAWLLEQRFDALHLVRAVSPGLELLEAGFQIDSTPALRRIRTELDARVDEIGADVADYHVVEDRPSTALLDAAHEFGATAILVGSHGHDSVGSLVGANIGRLIHTSDVPVIAVPSDRRPTSTGLHVVGCEDDGEVPPLVRFVESVSGATDAARTHVVLSTLESEEATAKRLRDRFPPGFTGTSEVVLERLLHALVSASELADLVTIASHHDARLAGFLTDSVAHHLPAMSACPVALVPVTGAPETV